MPPNGTWYVGVVIPACNEEASIATAIRSVRQAIDTCPSTHASWITVVADSCWDRTCAEAAEALEGAGEIIECSFRSVGRARRLGVASQLRRFSMADPTRLWLASTDADSKVPPEWIATQLGLAERSSAAVAGVVRAVAADDLSPGTLAELLEDYDIYPDGTHPHVHGATLGVRADAYLDAGGWSDLALAEDHCLWKRLKERGWRVTSSCAVWVETSGRLLGRAQGGFADLLRSKLERLHAD